MPMTPVEELKAMDDVRKCKAQYFRFTDSKDWEALAGIFCREASLGGIDGPTSNGVDAIVDLIRRGTDRVTTVHHGHCHEVWIDSPEQARGIVAFEDLGFSKASDELVMHGYGYYHETYRFENGTWRIWECKIARKDGGRQTALMVSARTGPNAPAHSISLKRILVLYRAGSASKVLDDLRLV